MSLYNVLIESYCTRFKVGKPPLPYIVGKQFTVRSHTPPVPPSTERGFSLELDARFERQQKHPLERCLIHPPLRGRLGNQFVSFKISKEIRVGDNQRSQLAVVDILTVEPTRKKGPRKNTTLVAKFYDPLYNDHDTDFTDPFFSVDSNYSCEAATYSALEPLQGNVIPKFYGSFTLELPAPGHKSNRLVRLILLELVPGQSMSALNPADFSQRDRQMIMKNIIDAETLLYAHGVLHEDIFPRNIMINSKAKSTRHVVLIDFETSRTGVSRFPGILISPLLRWHKTNSGCDLFAFKEGWVDWDWQPWLELTYEDTRDSITDEMSLRFQIE